MIQRIPRGMRVVLILLVMLPVIWLLVARNAGEALRLWGLVAAMSLVPGFVIERVYPRDASGNVYDRGHPAHVKAIVLEIVVALLVGVVYVAIFALLS